MKNFIKKIILFFIQDEFDLMENFIVNKSNILKDKIWYLETEIEEYEHLFDKLTSNSTSMALDISMNKTDSTYIMCVSRIWQKERVELIEKQFWTMEEVSNYIKFLKRSWPTPTAVIDKPYNHHLI